MGCVVSVGGEGDGSILRALCVDLSAALNDDVVGEALACPDGHSGRYAQHASVLHVHCTVDVVLRRGVKRQVSGDFRGNVGCGRALELVASPLESCYVSTSVSCRDVHRCAGRVAVVGFSSYVGGVICDVNHRASVSIVLAVGKVNKFLYFARTDNEGVVDGGLCKAAHLDGVLHRLACCIVGDGHVVDGEVGLGSVVGAVAVEVAVSLNAARVALGAREVAFPHAVAVSQRAVIALREVEAVVVAVNGEQVSHVNRTAEELYCVVSSVGDIYVVDGRSVTNAVEGKAVMLDVRT